VLEQENDAMATCLACGADTFELVDLGEVHSAGRDVEPWSSRSDSHAVRVTAAERLAVRVLDCAV